MPKQALIMIDMQRGFLDSASPLCIPAAEETVPACAALIGRCHEAGVPVIYAVRHYRADGTDVEKPRAAVWASGGKPLSEDCAAHLSDAFPDAFTVLPQDYVLVKPRFSAFFHTVLTSFCAASACRPSCSRARPRPTASAQRAMTPSRSTMTPSCSRTARPPLPTPYRRRISPICSAWARSCARAQS